MGRNNRVRRKEKQKNEQKKIKKNAPSQRELQLLDEVEMLCYMPGYSLTVGEPPSLYILKQWRQHQVSIELRPLQKFISDFIDFLYGGEAPSGDLDILITQRQRIRKTDHLWLYPLLYMYAQLNSPALRTGDLATQQQNMAIEQLQQATGLHNDYELEHLSAPFHIALWLVRQTDVGESTKYNLRYLLDAWLQESPVEHLSLILDKFLKLKSPKPGLKTVQALETALVNLGEQLTNAEWLQGINSIITLFLYHRLTTKQLQLTAWKQLPKLSALAGLIERTDLGWGHTSLQSNTAATCLKLDKQIDLSNMPFIERIRLAAIRCRLTMCSTSGDKVEFERSLAELINLLSRGVPPDDIGSAKACLDATVDWLVSGIVKTTISVPAGELLQRLYRIRANDYRLNILIYLQNNEHIASKINAQNELQHIHSGLFFHALQEQNDSKKYIELFYRSLNAESKKELFIYSSRKIFLEMNTEQAQDNWQLVCGQLFERQTTPFVTIINGHPCEAGLLFYVVQASLGAKQSIDWLGQKNVTSIINSSESLLRQRSSSFNQVQIVELLNCLALSHHKNHLFQHWSELLNILTYLDPANKLYDFLQIGLSQLNKELEFNNETYQVFFSHCRAEPKLRKLLSALTKKTKLTKQKVTKPKAQSKSNKQNKSESAPKQPTAEPQLNIFGDLL